jgi:GAF domain-containing protein
VSHEVGLRAGVGAPIRVEGRLWGLISVASTRGPLPADSEERLAAFTELVATAVANAHAREELRSFADEQAALRRVAVRTGPDVSELAKRPVEPAGIRAA